MSEALRYQNLADEIAIVKPAKIVEIGTCQGERAELMIRAALQLGHPVTYIGFDLFEPPPDEEFSARKHPAAINEVYSRLCQLGAILQLIKGDTRETLPRAIDMGLCDVDLIFLDGGHSEPTVRSDFDNCLRMLKPGGVIMCDDYWNFPEGGGCKPVVDELDRDRFEVDLLDPIDRFAKPWGTLETQIARVRPR